ncbi:MAG: damage-inducible protein DinB [Spirochaetaceae bacterium]|jgi:uncharacterized damage-inducible protein DinB|nr:damage-inducible protein DinB [Spirochaetaceae bacterium]
MNEVLMYARYNEAGNRTIYGILSTLSCAEREKDRGSYYGSLSGLFRHVMGGSRFFLGMYRQVLKGRAAEALAVLDDLSIPEGNLTEEQWKDLEEPLKTLDGAYINMAEALTAQDCTVPVKTNWYGGNPAEVPLSFMLSQLLVHNTHHRGQISQILDSLKIDNDYSGINGAFLNP